MQRSPIVHLVKLSVRGAWFVILLSLSLAAWCTFYAAEHFSVATDVRQLFPANMAWTQRAGAYLATFPQYDIIAVVDAPTPELAERAAASLGAALGTDREHIRAVAEPQGGRFFATNGLLFMPLPALARASAQMEKAAPLIGALAGDPSLRGALTVLSGSIQAALHGEYPLDALARPMNAAADTASDVLAGRPAHFSWRTLATGERPVRQVRFVEIAPVLDFKSLAPGARATAAIRSAIARLDLAHVDQARVRLTGVVPMNDAQFASLKENAALNLAITVGAVLLILWLALHSFRIMLAVAVSVACGLTWSAALGLYLVGSLNLISVAFFVLFIGLAVDFGLQFSVRYRAERHDAGDLDTALVSSGRKAGWTLALAAAATALGFSAFLPTDYRGLSELGEIAGPGMLIAFITSVTLLPALLKVLGPPGEPRAMGFSFLAPVDRFLLKRRASILVVTLAAVGLATPLLASLRFDFNTLHMENPDEEAVATFLELRKNPSLAASAVDVVSANLAQAKREAARLGKIPEVASTRTLDDFVPPDQGQKLALIKNLATILEPVLDTPLLRPPPSDEDNVAALKSTVQILSTVTNTAGPGAVAARRLSGLLEQLSRAAPEARQRASAAVVPPLKTSLDDLALSLRAQPVSVDTLPTDLKRAWVARDGRARAELLPKSDPDDTAALRAFVGAVLARNPSATGPAVILYEAGNTVVRAFVEAGLFALAAIALLLWLALGRLTDVAMTLIPLLLAAVLTLELCVLLGIQLNFTNIIAFPLLLGVGVAFKIYYIMAWRRGKTALVQSTLTRAVFFSALTTATAFGSLWLSRHPGTSSMGELMMLALVCTMFAAVLFQPALMGPPRAKKINADLRQHVPV